MEYFVLTIYTYEIYMVYMWLLYINDFLTIYQKVRYNAIYIELVVYMHVPKLSNKNETKHFLRWFVYVFKNIFRTFYEFFIKQCLKYWQMQMNQQKRNHLILVLIENINLTYTSQQFLLQRLIISLTVISPSIYKCVVYKTLVFNLISNTQRH